MIVAIIREAVFGTCISNFHTTVGYPPEEVGKIATDLVAILDSLGVHE